MKERLLTLLFALAALLCFYVLFFPKPAARGEQTLPLTTEGGAGGYLAAWRWLEAENVPLASLRFRYDRLNSTRVSAAATGNVLITTVPARLPFQSAEWPQLDRWIERGNTLLIMAALDDTPLWAFGTTAEGLTALQRMTRLRFTAARTDTDLRHWIQSQRIAFTALGQHPLMREVRSLEAVSELPASDWRAEPMDAVLPLAIARRAPSGQNVLWLKPEGRGQLIVCAFATPFSNQELGQADNALLLSNIIAWSRSGAGRVIFDDAHQGLVDLYDPAHFFADPRLHRTLLWLLLLWLVFVLGPQRLRAAPDRWQPVDETALIEAGGRFFSVAVDPADARRALFVDFFNRLRRRLDLPEDGEPVWDWIDAQAAMTAEQGLELHALYARVCADQRVDLQRLHNFLSTLRGQLT